MRGVLIYCLSCLSLQACHQNVLPEDDVLTADASLDPTAYLPKQMALAEGCVWRTKELEVFDDSNSIVSFRYANCGFEDATNFQVSNNGTTIKKAFYDVIYEKFHIFKRGDKPIEQFINELPVSIHVPGENCKPRKISERYWIINDGMELEAEINELPCGMYGRNFFGQTVFDVRQDIILNYNLQAQEDGIDKSSITLTKRSTP